MRAVDQVPPDLAWRRYFELTKPKVVAMILFTALVGMLLASPPGDLDWQRLLYGLLGIGLAAASGAAFNHVADRHMDAAMARTRARPLPAGVLATPRALAFALLLGAAAMVLLWLQVNPLTALLTGSALIGYAVFYTLFLKRRTPQNIVWGGLAGAAPPLLGWTAVSGTLDLHAFILVLLIFVWTPPHFWALAIQRRADYAAAGIPMLPVTHGVNFTKRQVLLYTLLLMWVSLMPYLSHMSGELYLVGALVLGMGYHFQAVRLWRDAGDGCATHAFRYSILYLAGLFGLLLVDHYVG